MATFSYVEGNVRTFVAGGAIAQYARVKLSAGELADAGAADAELGVAMRPAFAAGDLVPVRLRSAAGTTPMIAAGAISAGDEVYTDASGKIGTTNTNTDVGVALGDASGDGSVIEVLRK